MHRSLSFDACASSSTRGKQHSDRTNHPQHKRGAYKKWSKDDLTLALAAVKSTFHSPHHLTFEAAESRYHIPRATLYRYMQTTSSAIASAPRFSHPSDITDLVITTTRSGTPRTLLDSDTEMKLLQLAYKMEEMVIPVDLDMLRLKAMRLHYAANNTPITEENELTLAS